eukprot:CAMPEP_0181175552 /NCGR_PEP_ID=MMETSP1096-20121128/4141_1 /TAXON_ID=156174 ORGANISM="Chrysochromulina ericina, Strain CCMP281" /NCGR_SAMPLE_ID=MMETSP1096 /ASSEMBLY_ACC=CAM_ASM_000453 /LENGTH=151 /DNA_ID=CAMNT_0023263549 /DNA_START=60 /DNA_END=515 /DNA_ORIENTATION=+
MKHAWQEATRYESHSGILFEMVVFSRPDILFSSAMGPWCMYDVATQPSRWYTGGLLHSPDMFWIMSRKVADRVLGRTLRTLVDCTPGKACCCLRRGPSYWAQWYWTAATNVKLIPWVAGYGVVLNHHDTQCNDCYGWKPGQPVVKAVGPGN